MHFTVEANHVEWNLELLSHNLSFASAIDVNSYIANELLLPVTHNIIWLLCIQQGTIQCVIFFMRKLVTCLVRSSDRDLANLHSLIRRIV